MMSKGGKNENVSPETAQSVKWLHITHEITIVIIQQIVTMPIYGKEALNIWYPYKTDILRYT